MKKKTIAAMLGICLAATAAHAGNAGTAGGFSIDRYFSTQSAAQFYGGFTGGIRVASGDING